jgi:hypothetical protein
VACDEDELRIGTEDIFELLGELRQTFLYLPGLTFVGSAERRRVKDQSLVTNSSSNLNNIVAVSDDVA